MKTTLTLLFVISTFLNAQTINIAVAANVSYAIDELKAEFLKTHPDTKVQVTLGSSGKLTAQIKNGAPYGLFMSANMKYPEALYSQKMAITKPAVYARGALAYLSVKNQDFSKGVNLLKEKTIKRIAIANPKTAPYGKAAFEALKSAKVYEDIKSKFVYGESISQTLTYTVMAADIGMVAKSLLYSSKMAQYKEGMNWICVDLKLYTPIEQGVVLLKFSKNASEYRAFYDFIFSEPAKKIFKKYGYIIL
ncbi:MAG: molybdate ABC transporter substrate-binding protein [Sulfurimonas sp.]